MADIEVERKEALSRHEAADRLAALAKALAGDGHVELKVGADTFKMHVPDQVRCDLEVEVEGDEVEFEIELKWSTAAPKPKPKAAKSATKTTTTKTAARTTRARTTKRAGRVRS